MTAGNEESQADLLIVGAGAKAAAIAAKVHVLNGLLARAREQPIRLTIIEATERAASWSGRNGMTSGEEPLAIPPIKDVGFPYQSHELLGELGTAVNHAITEFTWQRYLIDGGGYARWVNAGSPAVEHREYGRYLTWVLAKATEGVTHVSGRVTRISLQARPGRETGARGEDRGTRGARGDDRWKLEVAEPTGARRYECRALVLTGPGVHRPLPHDSEVEGRIFHCDSRRSELARIPPGEDSEIAIVGGGESALSCVAFLRSFRPQARLTVYTPTLPMSRGESFLENRVFSNPDEVAWSALEERMRRDFVRHCDRGVFDPGTLARIAGDERCRFVTGRVTHVATTGDGDGLSVHYSSAAGLDGARCDFLVNCTGFDLLEQLRSLFPPPARAEIERRAGPVWDRPGGAEVAIGRALELEGMRPRLHIPGLAALSQGPGFANLGSLGLLADRVLQPLVLEGEARDPEGEARDPAQNPQDPTGARLPAHGRADSSWAASASSAPSPAGRPTS
jgi:mycobactin lysine-N-oxygenase